MGTYPRHHGNAMEEWRRAQNVYQREKSARDAARRFDRGAALSHAVRNGSNEIVEVRGRWLAVIEGETRIPRVPRAATT